MPQMAELVRRTIASRGALILGMSISLTLTEKGFPSQRTAFIFPCLRSAIVCLNRDLTWGLGVN